MPKAKQYQFLTIDEMNELLEDVVKKRKLVTKEPVPLSMDRVAIIHQKVVKFTVHTKYRGDIKEYYTFLDGRQDPQMISPGVAYTSLKNSWKDLPVIPEGDIVYERISASPLINYNPRFDNTRQEAWGYDLNSAYAAAMLKGWIDASVPPVAKEIDPETEIGFDLNLDIQREGFCYFTFKKMETPDGVKQWVARHYEAKKNATTKEEKLRAKQTLNYAVGMLQRKNPWLRAWVVASCNEYIKSLINEDTLFYNTDSIVSRVRRFDIEENIGNEIGQWKLEHEGVVAYRGNTYQWNNDKPTYRGVPKDDFGDDFDLLVSDKPTHTNPYYFDEKEMKIYGKNT